jgi:general secretion pathway protein I
MRRAGGFTLLEVLIAIAVLGLALAGLLSLQHQSLQSVLRGQELTHAAMLAEALMTEMEFEGFPALGVARGDFEKLYPRQFPNYRWEVNVEPSVMFQDVRKVEVRVLHGPGFQRSFSLVQFVHLRGAYDDDEDGGGRFGGDDDEDDE